MKLLVMRHADAASREQANVAYDRDRPLTPAGEQQAAQVATFLHGANAQPQTIVHAPARRCADTAQVLASAFDCQRLFAANELAPGCGDHDVLNAALIYADGDAWVLIVMHEPDVSCLLSTWNKSTRLHAPVRTADLFGFRCEPATSTFQQVLFFSPSGVSS